ncbi:extracellular solute-binding protein [Streptomyces sp. NBC_00838]|uniref:extracellular solute-binding protein n=1 Tax=Streptomyces sp. NBC_00838 TaxID=2903680 RepID=UPI00386FC675|nr:extracellular solute-binding protein [Streptomyces sp. NBC_00838]
MTLPRSPRPARFRSAGLAAALALTFIAACTGDGGDGPDSADEGTGTTAQGSGGPRHIWVASGRDVTGKGGIRQRLVDGWNAEQKAEAKKKGTHPYRAHLVELSGSADQQRSQLLGALQSGSAKYDVVNLDVTWVPEFAAAGLINTLDEKLLDSDVIDSVASTGRWNDDVYAAPFNSDVGLLYYRRDYLEQADRKPQHRDWRVKTWGGLREVINDVEEANLPQPYDKGWTTQLDGYEGRTVNAIEAFESADDGPSLVDGEGRYKGTEQSLISGVRELSDRTAEPFTLERARDSKETESLSDFTAGKTAFLRHWPTAYSTLHQTFEADQLGVMPLPGRAVLGGQNLAVSSRSQHAAAAEDLVGFLTNADSQCRLLRAGFAATRESVYAKSPGPCEDKAESDASALSPSPSSSGSGESADPTPRDEHGRPMYAAETLLTALKNAAQRPRTPYYGAFTLAFTTALDPLFRDSPPSDPAIAKALDKALREAMPTAD